MTPEEEIVNLKTEIKGRRIFTLVLAALLAFQALLTGGMASNFHAEQRNFNACMDIVRRYEERSR